MSVASGRSPVKVKDSAHEPLVRWKMILKSRQGDAPRRQCASVR
jgi:hypothetical protein